MIDVIHIIKHSEHVNKQTDDLTRVCCAATDPLAPKFLKAEKPNISFKEKHLELKKLWAQEAAN